MSFAQFPLALVAVIGVLGLSSAQFPLALVAGIGLLELSPGSCHRCASPPRCAGDESHEDPHVYLMAVMGVLVSWPS